MSSFEVAYEHDLCYIPEKVGVGTEVRRLPEMSSFNVAYAYDL
jgi:hypothetical protein